MEKYARFNLFPGPRSVAETIEAFVHHVDTAYTRNHPGFITQEKTKALAKDLGTWDTEDEETEALLKMDGGLLGGIYDALELEHVTLCEPVANIFAEYKPPTVVALTRDGYAKCLIAQLALFIETGKDEDKTYKNITTLQTRYALPIPSHPQTAQPLTHQTLASSIHSLCNSIGLSMERHRANVQKSHEVVAEWIKNMQQKQQQLQQPPSTVQQSQRAQSYYPSPPSGVRAQEQVAAIRARANQMMRDNADWQAGYVRIGSGGRTGYY
ncbi:hypothetical protein HDV00_008601 [Rhizophlyctis rosea]|nr:hypothetical protein HDV00_008601 [Rhizophlyctis rosea]